MEGTKKFLLRLEPELYIKLLDRAESDNRSVNSEIITILESAVKPIPIIGTIIDGKVGLRPEYEKYLAGESIDPRD